MASVESPPSSPHSSSISEDTNNHLQPFFVLHKASPRKFEKKVAGKAKRRIDLSPQKEKGCAESQLEDYQDIKKIEAFRVVWSKIDSSIKEVLRQINVDVFDKIYRWIRDSFEQTIRPCGTPDPAKSTRSHPLLLPHNSTSRQLFTGFVFTKNMELVDDVQTFADMALHLKSQGCLVANLSSSDFSAKNGVGGCLRSLLRQFLMVGIDAADMSILASWYSEHSNYKNPIVVILDDLERCCGPVLSDFVIMLSEWSVKIPVILVVGVATTVDAPRNILSSNALQCLFPSQFIVGSPRERMDAVLETVLVKCCAGFSIGHEVATFLRNYFLKQDGTLTSFIRALMMAVVQHICMEPLSLVLKVLADMEETKDTRSENIAFLTETMVKQALEIQSSRNERTEPNFNVWANGLSELHRLRKLWSSLAMCLYEAGKYCKVSLLDLYCEVLDPELYKSNVSDLQFESGKDISISTKRNCLPELYPGLHKDSFINKVIRKVRDLPAVELCQLLKRWEQLTEGFNEIHEEVKELQSLLTFDGNKRLRQSRDLSIHTRSNISAEKDETKLNEKAVILMNRMIRNHMQPIECIHFHEMVCFRKVDKLQSISRDVNVTQYLCELFLQLFKKVSQICQETKEVLKALLGDPRRRIQLDFLEFHKFLKCNCCSKNGGLLSLSMPDTSIMYTLAQEHGDLINLHDWFLSFKATISPYSSKAKKLKKLSSPKKKKEPNAPENKNDASVQARFCRAIIELQLVGLLRMPSKRRPDFVQRVAFGL